MQARSLLCLFAVLPSFWCKHLFLPVDQDVKKDIKINAPISKCAADCIKSIDFTKFCYGFTLDMKNTNPCTTHHQVKPPKSGSYFVLKDFHVSEHCPERKKITRKQAEGFSEALEEPKQRYFNGSLFLLVKETRAIKDCVKVCEDKKSTMVYINSKEENDFVRDFCTNNTSADLVYPCALGIKTKKNGTLIKKVEYYENGWNINANSKIPLNFVNYANGEPSSGEGKPVEECVGMFKKPIKQSIQDAHSWTADWETGQWNNMECSTKSVHCLCRKEIKKN